MTTEVLNLQLELVLRALVGALTHHQSHCFSSLNGSSHLEGQVLEEVRGAARLVGLGSGTSVNPDTNSRSLRPWRVLSRDLQALS